MPEHSVPTAVPSESESLPRRLAATFRYAAEVYEGMFLAPYRSTLYRDFLRERDVFFLLCCSDLLGVPNPVHFYSLELYPELMEHFHEWHLRMGMPHAPEGGFRCC